MSFFATGIKAAQNIVKKATLFSRVALFAKKHKHQARLSTWRILEHCIDFTEEQNELIGEFFAALLFFFKDEEVFESVVEKARKQECDTVVQIVEIGLSIAREKLRQLENTVPVEEDRERFFADSLMKSVMKLLDIVALGYKQLSAFVPSMMNSGVDSTSVNLDATLIYARVLVEDFRFLHKLYRDLLDIVQDEMGSFVSDPVVQEQIPILQESMNRFFNTTGPSIDAIVIYTGAMQLQADTMPRTVYGFSEDEIRNPALLRRTLDSDLMAKFNELKNSVMEMNDDADRYEDDSIWSSKNTTRTQKIDLTGVKRMERPDETFSAHVLKKRKVEVETPETSSASTPVLESDNDSDDDEIQVDVEERPSEVVICQIKKEKKRKDLD